MSISILSAWPTATRAEGGLRGGVRDEVDGEADAVAVRLDLVHGQRDAVERDRALGGDDKARARHRRRWSSLIESPTGSAASIVPMPSTWPVTIWPPSSSPTFSARSRLSRAPSAHRPAAVRLCVSAETSTANQSVALVDHRQADARAGDRGAEIDRRHIIAAGDAHARVAALLDGASTRPMSVMIPVNMASAPDALVDVEPVLAKGAAVGWRQRPCASASAARPISPTAARALADQDRRAIDEQAIDQIGGEEGGRRAGAALDQQIVDVGEAGYRPAGCASRVPALGRLAAR